MSTGDFPPDHWRFAPYVPPGVPYPLMHDNKTVPVRALSEEDVRRIVRDEIVKAFKG